MAPECADGSPRAAEGADNVINLGATDEVLGNVFPYYAISHHQHTKTLVRASVGHPLLYVPNSNIYNAQPDGHLILSARNLSIP